MTPRARFVSIAAAIALAACALDAPERPGYNRDIGGYPDKMVKRESGFSQTGMISYYADQFHGRKTASGEIFDMHELTAAHKTLPFNTRLEVTNLGNGKSVVVKVNDRGPYARGRILDVSLGAAKVLGLTGTGTAKARIKVL